MTAAALTYQDRKEQGICTRAGCRRAAADDSSMCPQHARKYRRLARESMARRRSAREAAGLCVECPVGSPAKASEGSTACLACRIRRRRIKISDRGDGVRLDVSLGREDRIAARTKTHADGRTRYHGQPRRGQQPREQLDAQDMRMAKESIGSFEQGLAILHGELIKAMPRVQRDGAKSAVLHEGERCIGHIEDILERHGHWKLRHGQRDGE